MGLDPEERIHFRNLFSQTAQDRLVLLSTHIIEDVQSVCGQLVVMDQGRVLFTGTPEALIQSAAGHVGVFWEQEAAQEAGAAHYGPGEHQPGHPLPGGGRCPPPLRSARRTYPGGRLPLPHLPGGGPMKALHLFCLELGRLFQSRLTWLVILLTVLSPLAGLVLYKPTAADTMLSMYLADPPWPGAWWGASCSAC